MIFLNVLLEVWQIYSKAALLAYYYAELRLGSKVRRCIRHSRYISQVKGLTLGATYLEDISIATPNSTDVYCVSC